MRVMRLSGSHEPRTASWGDTWVSLCSLRTKEPTQTWVREDQPQGIAGERSTDEHQGAESGPLGRCSVLEASVCARGSRCPDFGTSCLYARTEGLGCIYSILLGCQVSQGETGTSSQARAPPWGSPWCRRLWPGL